MNARMIKVLIQTFGIYLAILYVLQLLMYIWDQIRPMPIIFINGQIGPLRQEYIEHKGTYVEPEPIEYEAHSEVVCND